MKSSIALAFYMLAMLLLALCISSCDSRNPAEPVVLPEPVFSPAAGAYNLNQEITISCAVTDAIIRYTLNGSEPTTETFQYSNPLSLSSLIPTNASSITIKAKAYKTGNSPSPTVTAVYSAIYASTVAAPTIFPHFGSLLTTSQVYMECITPGAAIRYTTDGSEPTVFSTLYEGMFSLTQTGAVTVKARAFKYHLNPSEIISADFSVSAPAFNLVQVAGGTFNNGAADVTVSGFYLDPFEVTQADYNSVMGSNPAIGYGVGGSYPVYNVSWFDAIAYCNTRSLQYSLTPCYTYGSYGTNPNAWPAGWNSAAENDSLITCNWAANGYRLPTEAEWEFAARGGNSTHNYQFSGSNDLYDAGWFWDNWGAAEQSMKQIGGLIGNELMLFDLSGNIAEWVWDFYGEYPMEPQNNPHGAISGTGHVYRGGSWRNYSSYCYVWYRANYAANVLSNTIGFRVVRSSQ